MTEHHVRIATHRSPLALKYAAKIASEIKSIHTHLSTELVHVITKGDQYYFEPLPELGGKSLYGSAVDAALLDGRADIAAHVIEETARSAKDWPRGWLCAKSHLDEDNGLYFITDLKIIPQLIFSSSKSHC